VKTGAVRGAKLQSNGDDLTRALQIQTSLPTNQHPIFYRLDALPVAQPTVHSTEGKSVTLHRPAHPKLTRGSSNLVFDN